MTTQQTRIKYSVIVPVFNGEDIIRECLDALSNQSVNRSDYEIIVVDDGSTDNTAKIAAEVCDRVIAIKNGGPANARNIGVNEAAGEVILFTDADCVPVHDWVEKMTAPFAEAGIVGTKGAYYTRQDELVAQFVQAEYESKYNYMAQYKYIDFIDTYSAGFLRKVFLELKGFDTRFPGASVEDQEFSFRVSAAGYKMVFVPEARVFHRHAASLGHYFRKKFNIGYWKTLVLKLHPDKVVKDSHTPQTLKLQLPLAFLIPIMLAIWPILGVYPFLLVALAFLFTGFRETLCCLRNRYWCAAAMSPFIMWFRATGLGLGLIRGIVSPPISKLGLT